MANHLSSISVAMNEVVKLLSQLVKFVMMVRHPALWPKDLLLSSRQSLMKNC